MAFDRDAQAVQLVKEHFFERPGPTIRKQDGFPDEFSPSLLELQKDVGRPFVRCTHRCAARNSRVCSGGLFDLIAGVARANAVTSSTMLEQMMLRKIRSIRINGWATQLFRFASETTNECRLNGVSGAS
jgi:hypothetical protein